MITSPAATRNLLGVDLGGTNLRAGLVANGSALIDPTVLAEQAAPTNLEELASTLRRILTDAERRGPIEGIGITVPGIVDEGVCRWVPNLPHLDGHRLDELLGREATVANDAQLALLAEASLGAASDVDDAILLAIGTGIGSAVLSGGRVVSGQRGAACSFGWACLDVDDPGDHRAGWLERHAAGPVFDSLGSAGVPPRGTVELMDAARHGEPRALAAIEGPARILGTALAGAVALLNPALVLFAGGVTDSLDVLGPRIGGAMDRQLPPHLRGTPLVAGRFGPRAGLIGALVAADRGSRWQEIRT
jgi:predicted NBD/HSP70 family sugar kinase